MSGRRRYGFIGLLALTAGLALNGCGGDASATPSGKLDPTAFQRDPCDAFSKSGLSSAIDGPVQQAGLPQVKVTGAYLRFAGDLTQCRFTFDAKDPADPRAGVIADREGPFDLVLYNETTRGGDLMKACLARASARAASPLPSPSRGTASPRTTATPRATPSAAPTSPAGPATVALGDERCVEDNGQVRMRVGKQYVSVLADMSPATDPAQAVRDNQAIATAVLQALQPRLPR